MENEIADKHREARARLGISEHMIARRKLPLFEEAQELELAEVSHLGQRFLLIPEAVAAWHAMKSAAARDNIDLYIVSAYRSVERQAELVARKLDAGQAIQTILEVLAPPGCSEHHTGRAVDLGSGECRPLDVNFESTPAFGWLTHHAAQYGFALSFPQDNAYGYIYEPWHWCFSRKPL